MRMPTKVLKRIIRIQRERHECEGGIRSERHECDGFESFSEMEVRVDPI